MSGAPEEDRLNAVQKVCAVLRAVTEAGPVGLRDIAAASGLNKVTVLRILATLQEEDFVQRPPRSKLYALGTQAWAMGVASRRSPDLQEIARPALLEIAAAVGDSVVLSIRSSTDAICVDRQTGSFPIQSNYLFPGTRRPLGVGAGAAAILSCLPQRECDSLLGLLAPKLAGFPGLSMDDVRDQVAHCQAHGYTLVLDHIVDRMGGIGAPIRSPDGTLLAAISVVALSERIRDRIPQLSALLLRHTKAIERLLAAG